MNIQPKMSIMRKYIIKDGTYMENNKLSFAMYILMFNLFITMGGVGLILPVMPQYLETFGAGGQIYGFLIGIFAFAQFIFSPIAGTLSDKYGRKPFIIAGLVITGFATILFALATTVSTLFVSRFLTGLGAALVMPTIMAYVADITTPEERGKGMGLLGAAISLGFTIGPGIGGLLASVSLEFPFYFGGVTSIIAAMITQIVLKPVKVTAQPKVNENIFVQLARSTKTSYFMFLIVVFVFSFGIANYQATLSLYLDNKFDYSPFDISVIFMVGGFAGVLLQIYALDKLFKKFGEMNIILINLVIAAISMLGVIFVSGFFLMLLVTVIFAIATTFIRPAVNTLISKVAGHEQGFAAGMNNAYMSLGNMFGPILAGILYDWKMDLPYIVGMVVLLLCFMVAYSWALSKAPQLLNRA